MTLQYIIYFTYVHDFLLGRRVAMSEVRRGSKCNFYK